MSFILCFALLTPLHAATLLGEYRLEEAAWTGVAGEVKDASGNNRHGQTIGSPLPSPTLASPARTGNPGTCAYGRFPGSSSNGGALRLSGLPVNTAPGAKTSVSFWMYWDGTNSVMPIGWQTHDLWLVSGFFGFNTGNSDVYGINSTGLANGWHHVVAVFTNGNVAANALYIDGVAQALSQRMSVPNNTTAVVNNTLQVGGWLRDTSYRFSGRLDEVLVHDGALTAGEVATLFGATHPCAAVAIAEWSMDETSWTGAAGEVSDSLGSYAATAVDGAVTSAATPAKPSSPGTCAYGVFDGSNDYVALPAGLPNMTANFSVSGWIRTTDRARSGQRVLIDDESNTGGYGISLGDGGAGRLRFYARGSSAIILDTPAVINNNLWYFIAAVADISNGRRYLYVYDTAGTQLAAVSIASSGWGIDNGRASIGGETLASSEAAFHFVGNLDEIRLYSGALTAGEVAVLATRIHACPVPAAVLAAYRFEDPAWSGIAGEVKDSSGNNRHGVAVGAPFPVPTTTSPARAGNPGTCGYTGFSGGALNLPVAANTAPGAKTSVSFWMYWDGTNSVMPIGWQTHDLWLVGGFFGFNTGNSDVYGINSTGLANGWHHVVAVFTNGNVAANALYIDGVAQALSQKMSTPNNGNANANAILRVGGWLADAGYRFRTRVDEVKVYSGELTSAQVLADYNATHPCGSGTLPTSFNCIAAATPAASGTLFTQRAGASFSVDVAALNGAIVETNYAAVSNLNVTVELVDGSGATACASRTPLSPAVTQTLTFTAADQGRKASAPMTSSKAYPDVRCRVTDANQSPSIVACSTDNFAIRPGALALSTNANAAPPSAAALPTVKAGAAFTLNASTTTAPADAYTGGLILDASRLSAQISLQDTTQQSGGIVGALSLTPAILTVNTAVSNNAIYPEVGYLYLAPGALRDDGFTAVDQASGDCIVGSTSDVRVGGKYGCVIGNASAVALGRFIPDHFETAVSAGCGSFTYSGQPFALTLTAKNLVGGVTQNYSAAFSKAATLSSANGILGTFSPNPLLPSVFANGVADLATVPQVSFAFNNKLTAPTALIVRTTDSDGVSSATSSPIVEGSVMLRAGRLRLMNAYGSELLPIRVPIRSEFYTGTGWQVNAADNCTAFQTNALSVSNVVGPAPVISAATPNPLLLNNGQATLIFNPTGISGRFDLAANLNPAGVDTSCNNPAHGGTAANLSWLQGFWSSVCNGTPAWAQDPNARIQLGAPKAPYIYLRERY